MIRLRERADQWRSRVRVRVTTAAVVVGFLGAAVGSSLFVAGLHHNMAKALVSSARQQSATVAAQLKFSENPAQASVTGKNDIIVQIIGPDGKILGTDHPSVTKAIRTTGGTDVGVHVKGLPDTYSVHARTAGSGKLVVVGLSEEQVEKASEIATALLSVGAPVGVLLLGVVVWLAMGRALKPVEVMRREAAAITLDRLDERLEVPAGDDEIPLLATTLNEMLDRIQQSQAQQRQFVSDASHELRSPLAIMRQRLEVARRHPDDTTVPDLATVLWQEESRMEGLVKSLLTLARLDDGTSLHYETVDLDDIVLREVARIRAKNIGVRFDLAGVSAGQVQGDPVLLSQVVTNLVANAARHARSLVRVTLAEQPDRVRLGVEDDGEGIAGDQRERVFERFARLDEARTRDRGGAGLGLAIVKKVTESAGGRVEPGDSDLGGALFVVSLPRPVIRA